MSGVRVPCRAHANAAPMHRHMIFLYSRNANVICDISGVCILPYAQIAYIHRWPYSMMQESGPTSRHDFFFFFHSSLFCCCCWQCALHYANAIATVRLYERENIILIHQSDSFFFALFYFIHSLGRCQFRNCSMFVDSHSTYYVCKFVCICAAFTRP